DYYCAIWHSSGYIF
nr:immunoglobulin light chain junction region [Macaca mulatta]MOX17247.1 immunoglobulin light chain junction region [Macaca mulatta]MOX18669.1 immunoglobulin light chain junction region [Macaca mulatta]MOX20649.1 immunoglobulin light chain junction region [Macaca mulatta]MOX21170.1 immunoglobulin light chain junction region [Macaca mulatta]